MKRFSNSWILLFVIFFSSCTSINLTVPSEGYKIVTDFTGIVHAGDTNTKKEYDYLNYMGVSWILHTFYWSSIESQQGKWNFRHYDTIVNNAKNSNLKVLGVLAYDTSWIHPDQKSHDYIPPERLPDFLNYIRMTVEHFKGRVDAWCIWNEPNGRFWNGTTEEFVELFRQTAEVIKETDEDVILLGGAFNRSFMGLPKKMINGIFESGAMEYVDAVAFHPYELNVNRAIRLYEKFKKFVSKYDYADKIWITEIGFPTGGLYPTRVSDREFPSTIVKICAYFAASGAKKIFWYQMFDAVNRVNTDSENFFGLVRSNEDYTSKGAEAFRLCATYFSDSICYGYSPQQYDLPKSVNVFCFKQTDGGALVLWKNGAGSTQVNLKLPGTEHLRHDIETGSVSSIYSDIIFDAGNEPVFITWRNSSDSLEKEENPVIRRIR
jgi:hypothetical protein